MTGHLNLPAVGPTVDQDHEGQVVLYTGLYEDANGTLWEIDKDEEYPWNFLADPVSWNGIPVGFSRNPVDATI